MNLYLSDTCCSKRLASDWSFYLYFQYFVLDRRQAGPIKSVLLVIIGWLVGSVVFSETAQRIFLIFFMKLGGYKGRKFTEPDFWKKTLIWRYSRKDLQISPKSDTLIFFSKTALTIFWFLAWSYYEIWPSVWVKAIFHIFDLEVVKKMPKLRFLAIFSTSHH